MLTILLGATTALTLLLPPVEAGARASYVRLSGKRLTRFYKSKGATELGRGVSLRLPARAVAGRALRRWDKKGRFLSFSHRGVLYIVARRNPYLAQTARKLKKSPRGVVLVKGRVRAFKKRTDAQKGRAVAVMVDTLQKTGKGTSRLRGRRGRG